MHTVTESIMAINDPDHHDVFPGGKAGQASAFETQVKPALRARGLQTVPWCHDGDRHTAPMALDKAKSLCVELTMLGIEASWSPDYDDATQAWVYVTC
jgi:hypothetical protein